MLLISRYGRSRMVRRPVRWLTLLVMVLVLWLGGAKRPGCNMLARLCDSCDLCWPNDKKYERCAKCRTVTRVSHVRRAMGREEAESLRKTCEFDHFYEQREAARMPWQPEVAGLMEAKKDIDLIRQLEDWLKL